MKKTSVKHKGRTIRRGHKQLHLEQCEQPFRRAIKNLTRKR